MIEVQTSGKAIFGYENGEYYFRFPNSEKTRITIPKAIPPDYVPYYEELKRKVDRNLKLQKLLET